MSSQVRLKRKTATKVTQEVNAFDEVLPVTRVTYHGTDVVIFDDEKIILNTGGWKTVTTKARMNLASQEFVLGYWVYRSKGLWYVVYNNIEMIYGNSTDRNKHIIERER